MLIALSSNFSNKVDFFPCHHREKNLFLSNFQAFLAAIFLQQSVITQWPYYYLQLMPSSEQIAFNWHGQMFHEPNVKNKALNLHYREFNDNKSTGNFVSSGCKVSFWNPDILLLLFFYSNRPSYQGHNFEIVANKLHPRRVLFETAPIIIMFFTLRGSRIVSSHFFEVYWAWHALVFWTMPSHVTYLWLNVLRNGVEIFSIL